MSERTVIPLVQRPLGLRSTEFNEICGWNFRDPYVGRLLKEDIPQRMHIGPAAMWFYSDPSNEIVGFGSFSLCDDCGQYTGGKIHPYIPLLAVNPAKECLGHGTSIVRHLIEEAAVTVALVKHKCFDVLFLDVYESNSKAIKMYEKCDFIRVTEQSIPDWQEGGAPYIIMAKRLSLASK